MRKTAEEQLHNLHFIWHINSMQIKTTDLEYAYATMLNKYIKQHSGKIVMTLYYL